MAVAARDAAQPFVLQARRRVGDEPLVFRDARKDVTFGETPAVQELGIVAYAGVPLMHGGHALVTLC